MNEVRIYRPTKNAMQSGRANTRHWVLEFEPTDREEPDALMGWNGSADTRAQVRLRFSSKEAAIAFAERKGLAYRIADERAPSRVGPKNYADNFRFDRRA